MAENMMNEQIRTAATNDTRTLISEAECHENLRKLMGLGTTIDYYQVVGDPDLVERYVELITSMLYDDRATGRSFDELFPQIWLNSYREMDESCREPRQRALPGLWPKAEPPHNWQVCNFYPQKRKDSYLSLPRFSALAQALFVRHQLLPLAMMNLKGFLRHYVYGMASSSGAEKRESPNYQRIAECLRTLDGIKRDDYLMLLRSDEET